MKRFLGLRRSLKSLTSLSSHGALRCVPALLSSRLSSNERISGFSDHDFVGSAGCDVPQGAQFGTYDDVISKGGIDSNATDDGDDNETNS